MNQESLVVSLSKNGMLLYEELSLIMHSPYLFVYVHHTQYKCVLILYYYYLYRCRSERRLKIHRSCLDCRSPDFGRSSFFYKDFVEEEIVVPVRILTNSIIFNFLFLSSFLYKEHMDCYQVCRSLLLFLYFATFITCCMYFAGC